MYCKNCDKVMPVKDAATAFNPNWHWLWIGPVLLSSGCFGIAYLESRDTWAVTGTLGLLSLLFIVPIMIEIIKKEGMKRFVCAVCNIPLLKEHLRHREKPKPKQEAAKPTSLVCPKCSRTNDPAAKFCATCGSSLEVTNATAQG